MFLHDEMMAPPGNWRIVCHLFQSEKPVKQSADRVQCPMNLLPSAQCPVNFDRQTSQKPGSQLFTSDSEASDLLDELCDEQLDPTTSFQL